MSYMELKKCYFLALLSWVIEMCPDHTKRNLVTDLNHGLVLVNDYRQKNLLENENLIAIHTTTSRAKITK